MKRILILTTILLSIMSCGQSAKPDGSQVIDEDQQDKDIKAVKTLVRQSFEDIWSDLDTSAINQYHTRDFLLLENGMIWNNDSIAYYLVKENLNQKREKYQRLNHFDFLKSVHHQNSIWVAYHNYGTWIKGKDTVGTAHWLESVVAIRDGDQWQLEQMHSTKLSN
ncbi:MAG TPA: hypothetical protein VJ917_06500 [Saprospiraceae bacterium]|nr:hypothetical protein [Saprospiraceae bacterium]